MARPYCLGLDTGFISKKRCSKSDDGRHAPGIASLERAYAAPHTPVTVHPSNTVFPKSRKNDPDRCSPTLLVFAAR